MVPKIMHAKRPTCQRNRSVQNGSSAAGPFGQFARLAFIDAKKAWLRPVPSVRGMPAGTDDGTIHPTIASASVDRSTLNETPSEISNSMRGADDCDGG